MEEYGQQYYRMENDYEDYLYLKSLREAYIPDKNLQKAITAALRLNTNQNRVSALNALAYRVEHEELGSPSPTKRRQRLLNTLYDERDSLYTKLSVNTNTNSNNERSVQTGDPSNTESNKNTQRRSRRVQRNRKNRKTRRSYLARIIS